MSKAIHKRRPNSRAALSTEWHLGWRFYESAFSIDKLRHVYQLFHGSRELLNPLTAFVMYRFIRDVVASGLMTTLFATPRTCKMLMRRGNVIDIRSQWTSSIDLANKYSLVLAHGHEPEIPERVTLVLVKEDMPFLDLQLEMEHSLSDLGCFHFTIKRVKVIYQHGSHCTRHHLGQIRKIWLAETKQPV